MEEKSLQLHSLGSKDTIKLKWDCESQSQGSG